MQQKIFIFLIFMLSWSNVNATETIRLESLNPIEKKQIHCLAQNIYFEALNESKEGRIAVAMVTLNRVSSGNYANDICGVVNQRIRGSCQFTWVCMANSIKKKQLIKETILYNEILMLSTNVVYNYHKIRDSTNGATYFHSKNVRPNWKLIRSTKIGNHIFYIKEIDKRNIKKEFLL